MVIQAGIDIFQLIDIFTQMCVCVFGFWLKLIFEYCSSFLFVCYLKCAHLLVNEETETFCLVNYKSTS